jgi:hypothetical protein
MKKTIIAILLLTSVSSFANLQMVHCESHTYGDQVYDLKVDLKRKEALLVGSDTWYHEDFMNEHITDLAIQISGQNLFITHPEFKAILKFQTKEAFASPVQFRRLKLDFDCR